jgi:hypothetical protein
VANTSRYTDDDLAQIYNQLKEEYEAFKTQTIIGRWKIEKGQNYNKFLRITSNSPTNRIASALLLGIVEVRGIWRLLTDIETTEEHLTEIAKQILNSNGKLDHGRFSTTIQDDSRLAPKPDIQREDQRIYFVLKHKEDPRDHWFTYKRPPRGGGRATPRRCGGCGRPAAAGLGPQRCSVVYP